MSWQTGARRYPRPPGRAPDILEPCPLCRVAPHVAHERDCPWWLWADTAPPNVLPRHRKARA